MTTPFPHSLCQPLNVKKEQPIVLQKMLMPGYIIGLRPVSMHDNNDINAIHEWQRDGYPGKAGLPADQLRVYFILLAESTYAQSFMVLLNGITPIGQLEVYQVLHDELNNSIDAAEGDFRIYVPVMPLIVPLPELTVQILQTCLWYFLSCSEVKRVFWVIPVNDAARNKLAVSTGFGLLKSFCEINVEGDQPAHVYLMVNGEWWIGLLNFEPRYYLEAMPLDIIHHWPFTIADSTWHLAPQLNRGIFQ